MALRAPLSSAAESGVAPACCDEYWRQSLSSKRNWSKLFPVPGKTITLGPLGGRVVQAVKLATAPAVSNTPLTMILIGFIELRLS